LCRGLLFDAGFYDDQAGRIGGGAYFAAFGLLQIYHATVAQPIFACVKWNGFDNFT